MKKKNFEKSLRLTKITLLCSGIKVYKTKFRKSIEHFLEHYLYYLNLSWLYLDIYGEIHWVIEGILTGKSFIYLSITAPCITISMLGTCKVTFLYFNRDIVIKAIDKLKEIHPEDIDNFNEEVNNIRDTVIDGKTTDVERDILKESTKLLKFVVLILVYAGAVVCTSFMVMPITSMAYDYYMTGNTEWKYPFLVKYFFDVYTATVWPAMYVHHAVSTYVVFVNMVGPDTLLYASCTYVHMHFRLLCHRLENIVSASTEQTTRNLASAVRRHHDLIDLVNQIEFLFSKSILVNIVTSSLLICLSGFIITVVDEMYVWVTFAAFLVMSLSQIALLCFFGDMLMQSSTQVSSAVYNSLWYEANQRTKRTILLILMRAQKPCKLTACNFGDLNLSAFTKILSRSWSYFALLRTMLNK